MKWILLLLLWQTAASVPRSNAPERQFFLYQRAVVAPAAGQSCAVLDASVFEHAAPALRDLRVFAQTAQAHEIPFAITLSEPAQPDVELARVFNRGTKGDAITFDLAMPHRPYTEVVLDLAGKDYIVSTTVTGMEDPGGTAGTRLGEFTLFDLSSQHLSRSTKLPLQESTFPYLHVEMKVSPSPGARRFQFSPSMVLGATVPPSREAQTIFAPAVESRTITQRGRQSVAHFRLPQRVPVERVNFVLAPQYRSNFSRNVSISDHASGTPVSAGETISGNIFRVHMNQAGREINQQQLSVPATLGSNLQSDADVQIAVNNGDDAPLPIVAVQLQMRQRRLCFNASSTDPLTLFYGDPTLTSPDYDLARTIQLSSQTAVARLGPEQRNPVYVARPDTRSITERHPELIWVAFLGVICVLAVIAIRSSKHLSR